MISALADALGVTVADLFPPTAPAAPARGSTRKQGNTPRAAGFADGIREAVHGLEAVLVAAEIALEAGRSSAEHVLNVLARLKDVATAIRELTQPTPGLKEEPRADVQRYDALRNKQEVRP